MRQAIIASAVAVLIAGAGTYVLVVGSASSPISEPKTNAVERSRLEESRPSAALDDVPRTRIGNLIIISPTLDPDIVTGSVNPTAKPGQAAKAAKAQKPKAAARKQAQPRRQPNSPADAPAVVTMANPSGAISGAE